ncbi:histidine phosphatase family protein [Pseudoalteromonas piscicida]|uniref:histidine phosphatase family protein n=1 Tax=Pseudoalteromonas piscicida TaxID=43662 RepID=UPI0030C8DDDD
MQRQLYFVRHGETTMSDHLLGVTDPELSTAGAQQLLQSLTSLGGLQRVISSPRKRCLNTAKAFAKQYQLPVDVEQNLAEFDFGQWDGKPYDTLWRDTQSPSIGDFWQNPWQHTPPEGESMHDFHHRVATWWHSILASPSEECIAVVAHAGVIKALIALILDLPPEFTAHQSNITIPYAGIVKVEIFYDSNQSAWPKVVF